MIDSAAELEILPEGSIIVSASDDVGCVYAKWPQHHLASMYGPWYSTGYEVPCCSDEIELPARLVGMAGTSGA